MPEKKTDKAPVKAKAPAKGKAPAKSKAPARPKAPAKPKAPASPMAPATPKPAGNGNGNGIDRLNLAELKLKSMQDLTDLAVKLNVENPSGLRKQELIFELLQQCASQKIGRASCRERVFRAV